MFQGLGEDMLGAPYAHLSFRCFVDSPHAGGSDSTNPSHPDHHHAQAMVTLPQGCIHTVEQVIERSRFITTLGRTDSEQDARELIALVRSEHSTATHNCTAFYISGGNNIHIERSSDDGEPSGTAGAPMLNTLRHSGMSNLTAIVTRYFGGIKLGTGGLVDAYSSSVQQALDSAPRISREPALHIAISTSAAEVGKLDGYLRNHGIDVTNIDWVPSPRIHILLPPHQQRQCESMIQEISRGQASSTVIETILIDRQLS